MAEHDKETDDKEKDATNGHDECDDVARIIPSIETIRQIIHLRNTNDHNHA